jgi:hypothetical protein
MTSTRSIAFRVLRAAGLSFLAGGVIGAANGLAMVASDRHHLAELDIPFHQAALFWTAVGATVGCLIGTLIGVACSELFFQGVPTRSEVVKVSLLTLVVGAAFSFAFGDRLMQVSWLAAPAFAFLASLVVRLSARARGESQ